MPTRTTLSVTCVDRVARAAPRARRPEVGQLVIVVGQTIAEPIRTSTEKRNRACRRRAAQRALSLPGQLPVRLQADDPAGGQLPIVADLTACGRAWRGVP